MESTPNIYIDVIVYLVAAVLISLICKRINVSSTLGYLIVGVLLGPQFLGIISDVETSKAVGEFGVVFLLFTIGLELPFERLRELKRYVFLFGGLQVLLSGAVITLFALYIGASIETSILIGSGLALSSTAVVLQYLTDNKDMGSRHGRITFSILLFQDLVVVVLLVWLTLIQNQHDSVFNVLGQAFLRALVVLIGFAILGRFLLRPIYRAVAATGSTELFVAMTLLVVLSTSMATQVAGLSLELGAFLAGLLLSETEYRHQVDADIKPYKSLLLGLFFMTVGMSINPHILMDFPGLILSILGLMILIKLVVILAITHISKLPFKSCLRIALLLAGGGEFVFVLFSQAEKSNIITSHLCKAIYIAVVISMALTPIFGMLAKLISKKIGKDIGMAIRAAEEESSDLKDHTIIVGFGRVGQAVHKLLNENIIPHVMIDMSMKRVAEGRDKGYSVYFGDGRRVEVFQALGAERAKSVIITVSNFTASSRMVVILKRYFPHLDIFVRVGDTNEAYQVKEIGAHPIVPEIFAPSFQLAAAALELYNVPTEQIDRSFEKFRQLELNTQEQSRGFGSIGGAKSQGSSEGPM